MSNIIQWNLQSLKSKFSELKLLLNQYSPACVCLQETLAHINKISTISRYNVLHSEVTRNDGHERGASIIIHKKLNYDLIQLNTNLQAVAAKIYWNKQYTICSLYLPHIETNKTDLQHLINQLQPPFLLLGDFNARSTQWGDISINTRGNIISELLFENDIILLNNSQPTHYQIQTNSYSNIDLSIASADCVNDFSYSVLDSLHGSDHFPIKIDNLSNLEFNENQIRYNLSKADWKKFNELTETLPPYEPSIDGLLDQIETKIIQAADHAIPTTSPNPSKPPVPWWNTEIRDAIRNRKRAERSLRRNYTLQNKIAYNRFRAKAKYLCDKSREASWNRYVSSINQYTSLNKIWQKTKKIAGKFTQSPSPILKINDQIIDSKDDVANKLAETFANVSDENNYSTQFRRHKNLAEQETLHFETSEDIPYNRSISKEELSNCLAKTKESAPGIDKITYSMIKHSHETIIALILTLYNLILREARYPERWRTAIIIPIPKPNKDSKNPTNYRPISLTCCLSKLLEKIINIRLMWYLEKYNLISNVQTGFRANKSTTDNIVKLQDHIHHAMAAGLHTVVVFFDLTKAYDMAWRYGVVKTLHDGGMRGNLPKLIQNFLYNRKIMVRIGNTLSSPKVIQEGILQGSVLSCTCFLLSINNIAANIGASVKSSLYVDDFTIFCSGSMLNNVTRRLQLAINNLHDWTRKSGYKFSATKTLSLHVCRKRGCSKSAILHYNGTPINNVESCRYLGVIFDKSLTWRPHIRQTKESCSKVLDLLKHLSHKKWGADRLSLLRLYNMLVKPKLEYGCEAYASACTSLLNTLEPIQNKAIRIATGAYKSSPILSLCAESGTKPLSYSRDQKMLNYLLRIFSSGNFTLQDQIAAQDLDPDQNQFIQKSFIFRAKEVMTKYNLDFDSVTCDNYSEPPWEANLSSCKEMYGYQKNRSSPYEIKTAFYNHIETTQHENVVFTDGSKTENRVGYAMVYGSHVIAERLTSLCSIFTAELYAIDTAIDYAIEHDLSTLTVATDSKSSIMSLHSISKHELVKKIRGKSRRFPEPVTLCWVPSHVGIRGNETADKEAKNSLDKEIIANKPLPNSDYKIFIKRTIRNKWWDRWAGVTANKYRRLTEKPQSLPGAYSENRLWERTLSRLRIGHSHLTHSYLMNRDGNGPPQCDHCDSPVTIEHILTECDEFRNERRQCFNTESPSLPEILAKNLHFSRDPLYRFLTMTNLINSI